MTWVKLDDQFPDHPKVAGLTDGAFRLFVSGLCYCSKHLTDGHIPESLIARWGVRHSDRAASELISAGLWRSAADHYEVIGYLDHQRSKVEARSLSVKRSKAGKRGGNATATAKQLAKQTPGKPQAELDDRGQRTDTEGLSPDGGQPTDDDRAVSKSSSEDLRQQVFVRFAELVADDQAEPPRSRSAFMTGVVKKAKRERKADLAGLLHVRPNASPEDLADWLYGQVDPDLLIPEAS